MALEQACMQVVPKPWGRTDLLPWSEADHDDIGKGCFIEAQLMRIAAGQDGLSCLVAYDAATPGHDLLRALVDSDAVAAALSLSPLPILADSPPPFTEARS